MDNEQDLSGMGAEETLVTSQGKLKSVTNSLEVLQNYLDDNNRNETSIKVSSILDMVIPKLAEIYQDNEKVINMIIPQ